MSPDAEAPLTDVAADEEPRLGARIRWQRWVARRRQLAAVGQLVRFDGRGAWRVKIIAARELRPTHLPGVGGFWRQEVEAVVVGRCAEGEWA